MKSQIDLLSFLDLLDLDEEIIDTRLKSLMSKSELSNKNLTSVIYLLQYKELINTKESEECFNDEEFDFVVKLIQKVSQENIDALCQILNLVLRLNPTTVASKAEHLLHQILANIDIPTEYKVNEVLDDCNDETNDYKTLHYLKVCGSILDSIINVKEKISLLFLELPLEKIVFIQDEKTRSYFLICIVPKLFEVVTGYSILDKIWDTLSRCPCKSLALKVLISLTKYYLPILEDDEVQYKSTMTHQLEFWSLVLFGLQSDDPSLRKFSIYLAKRAIDSLLTSKTNVIVKSEAATYVDYDVLKAHDFKKMWENYFILVESLEEKQSNIVLPSLLLFDLLEGMADFWLNCAFKLALEHDNSQIRLKCLQYRLMKPITSEDEAKVIADTLNDFNYYDNEQECRTLNQRIIFSLSKFNNLTNVLKAIPKVKWSPVPLYNLSKVLSELYVPEISANNHGDVFTEMLINILIIPCNNVPLRRSIFINISDFIARNFDNISWKECLAIYPYLNLDKFTIKTKENNRLVKKIKSNLIIDTPDIDSFLNALTNKKNIEFALLYLDKDAELVSKYIEKINTLLLKIENVTNRQYSNKTEVLNEVIYITQLLSQVKEKDSDLKEQIHFVITRQAINVLKYMTEIMSNETNLNDDEIRMLFDNMDEVALLPISNIKETLLNIHKTARVLLQDPLTKPSQMLVNIFALSMTVDSNTFKNNYKHEMINVKNLLKIHENFYQSAASTTEGSGRIRNSFYEKLCEILFKLIKDDQTEAKHNLKELVELINNITDYGGYGCLIWILKLFNHILNDVLDSNINMNIPKFIKIMWAEIDQLKTNKLHSPCLKEFVNFIVNLAVLKKQEFNNTITYYCENIIEYGLLKNTPLYHLSRKINQLTIIDRDNGLIVYLLSQILLFSPVPKKDQRIADNYALDVLQNSDIGIDLKQIEYFFNHEIQWLAVSTLSKIKDPEVFNDLNSLIISKVDELLKNKARYHGNSQSHRQLLFALQNLLLISILNPISMKKTSKWCLELLGKLPHQPSIRLCLEWYVTRHLLHSGTKLDEKLIHKFSAKNVPKTSQFMILYWAVKNNRENTEEYKFVMDTLLSYSMGQMFNVRLHAQYLATKLYNHQENAASDKYRYTMTVINKTFESSSTDKNFLKLQKDYFANVFDIDRNLTPSFIYYFVSKYFDITHNEKMDLNVIRDALQYFESNDNGPKIDIEEVLGFNFEQNRDVELFVGNVEKSVTLQKKYIPWKSMTDIEVYDLNSKKPSPSELIVVASLIDKLPNLGGMARTGEVFGVKTYVIDSLRHLQDRQFQGLSVSAERWINIEEVRPGSPLIEYLLAKKAEGYSVVAAEQTSTSSKLQNFKFPKKTLLLLGHEKDGIPCDLLPMMDYCVEIPQQGYVRSLNVHVTAAIFVWEYSRQNIL